jgi:uncharacterized protein
MAPLEIQTVQGGVGFVVKVVPGSSRTSIAGTLDSMLKVKVAAPPEKGKANQALIGFLALTLGVRKGDIAITHGLTKPVKHVTVSGLTPQDLRVRLGFF